MEAISVQGRNVTRMRAVRGFAALTLIAALAVTGCSSAGSSTSAAGPTKAAQPSVTDNTPGPTFDSTNFRLTSSAYANGGDIPEKYTCMGVSASPPLAWSGAPIATVAFVLIMEDYSAQITHWVVYNIPGSPSGSLPENAARTKGAVNQVTPYLGPCPGSGNRNNYNITLYALSATLSLTDGTVEDAMADKVLAKTELSGWFGMD
jgi:Raf kinase inhibitor-like YbhB/YbcL family protein